MSLINEALKKAQRLRTEEQAAVTPPVPGGQPATAIRRPSQRNANFTLLVASGAVVLVVLSVVVTAFLLNRPPKATAMGTPAAGDAAANANPAPDTPPAIVLAPVIKPTEPPPAVGATSAAAATTDAELPPVATAVAEAAPAAAGGDKESVANSRAATAPGAVPSTPAKPDTRIYTFVDNIRVTGIRSSGNDSRVLMNERVYRVNDIVERTLGVRLVRVDTDSLTFSDENGAIYVKYF